jgi:cytochrome c biogenesis protein CcdA/thiol-disulfide isomerase/thioredoxin
MVLLAVFAFLAGAATAVSPCVLPILPAVLSAGVTGGRRRPLGVVVGLAAAFTFATVALVYVIDALGLRNDLMRDVAIVVLVAFGLSLLIPGASDRVEALISRVVPAAQRPAGDGFTSGVLLGASLGFVYAPCAGPILASVVVVSAAQEFTIGKLVIALAYAAGSATVLYLLIAGGRRITSRIAAHRAIVQPAMGAVMLVVAALMVADLDLEFERTLGEELPAALVTPTADLERSSVVADDLDRVRGGEATAEAGVREAEVGERLPVLGRAPELQGTQEWFNAGAGQPRTIAGLRGQVVLVDFWTYTCINCIRTLPYLQAWNERYGDEGLTVLGVHTPEFAFEKDPENVARAIDDYGLTYPVVQDNDYATWTAYANQFWPAKYLIDDQGRIRFVHFGEGSYEATESAIRALLKEAGDRSLGARASARAQRADPGTATPESYLGAERAARFVGGPIVPSSRCHAGVPATALPTHHLAYEGCWRIRAESATSERDASLSLRFHASRVFLVMGARRGPVPVKVLLDGRPIPDALAGADVRGGEARVGEERLYRLVRLRDASAHVLTLRFAPGIAGYAFTFG